MQPDRPKYVIVNEYDAPEPRMVCQWVPGVGYCYMDRTHGKSRYDGMTGSYIAPVFDFGFDIMENTGGLVSFHKARPSVALYLDGEPRRWQSSIHSFSRQMLEKKKGRRSARPVPDAD